MTGGLPHIGKFLIIFGIIMIAVGGLLLFSGKIPLFGRLPGDFVIQRKNVTFYLPLATSLLLSLILSFIFWLIGRR